MNPREKRFIAKYLPMANAVARLDIPQTVREQVAAALTEAIASTPRVHADFDARAFQLLASDPLSACRGRDGEPCPNGIEIRTAMHLSSAPDGHSILWQETKPTVQCVECELVVRLGTS